MKRKAVSTTFNSNANTYVQGLRILARIIARKLVCGVDFQKENEQIAADRANVRGREKNRLVRKPNHEDLS